MTYAYDVLENNSLIAIDAGSNPAVLYIKGIGL